jgi:hypothetical protein
MYQERYNQFKESFTTNRIQTRILTPAQNVQHKRYTREEIVYYLIDEYRKSKTQQSKPV